MQESKVKCEICGKYFKSITRTHLKKHGLTVAQYKSKFPNVETHSTSTKKLLSTNNLQYWTRKHGEREGKKRYEEYKKFLAEKNTFEYKKKTLGWDKKMFDEFNKKRAVTLENMISKYGKVEGSKRYQDYVETQRHAGISKEYFIEKLGRIEGEKTYKEICNKKAHTLQNYIKRYGNKKEAIEKLKQFFAKIESNKFSSEFEREFVAEIVSRCAGLDLGFSKVYSILNNEQYGLWSKKLQKLIKLDLVILDINACIEFNGNYWHCNPKMYTESFIHPVIKKAAKDIWKLDEYKEQDIREAGFNFLTVWELDYKNDKDKTIRDVMKWICELKDQK